MCDNDDELLLVVEMTEVADCDDDVCVLMIVGSEDEAVNDSVVDNDCDGVDDMGGDTVEEDDVVELIGRDVVVGAGGAHLLGLSQSHGSEQLLKQF